MGTLRVKVLDMNARDFLGRREKRLWTVVEVYDPDMKPLRDSSTRGTGVAEFDLPDGTYIVGVMRESYEPAYNTVNLKGNGEMTITITRLRLSPTKSQRPLR